MRLVMCAMAFLLTAGTTLAQATRPTTRPSSNGSKDDLKYMSSDQLMGQLLKPTTHPSRPLDPLSERPVQDKSSGGGAVAPGAPAVTLLREGTFIVDRLARLTHGDKGQAELSFESDGKTLHDPPMIILPNQKLMQMEDFNTLTSRDLKFRVTGMVTEYRGRNYILLEKAIVIPDTVQQF